MAERKLLLQWVAELKFWVSNEVVPIDSADRKNLLYSLPDAIGLVRNKAAYEAMSCTSKYMFYDRYLYGIDR